MNTESNGVRRASDQGCEECYADSIDIWNAVMVVTGGLALSAGTALAQFTGPSVTTQSTNGSATPSALTAKYGDVTIMPGDIVAIATYGAPELTTSAVTSVNSAGRDRQYRGAGHYSRRAGRDRSAVSGCRQDCRDDAAAGRGISGQGSEGRRISGGSAGHGGAWWTLRRVWLPWWAK